MNHRENISSVPLQTKNKRENKKFYLMTMIKHIFKVKHLMMNTKTREPAFSALYTLIGEPLCKYNSQRIYNYRSFFCTPSHSQKLE
jgi:hypothetical protein